MIGSYLMVDVGLIVRWLGGLTTDLSPNSRIADIDRTGISRVEEFENQCNEN